MVATKVQKPLIMVYLICLCLAVEAIASSVMCTFCWQAAMDLAWAQSYW